MFRLHFGPELVEESSSSCRVVCHSMLFHVFVDPWQSHSPLLGNRIKPSSLFVKLQRLDFEGCVFRLHDFSRLDSNVLSRPEFPEVEANRFIDCCQVKVLLVVREGAEGTSGSDHIRNACGSSQDPA